jgi:hypothetical protein
MSVIFVGAILALIVLVTALVPNDDRSPPPGRTPCAARSGKGARQK